jgi:ribonuclease HI
LKKVTLYTDGACSGNPGPGGWACVLIYGEHEKELSGGAAETTNNRMEMTAALEGLKILKRPCKVEFYTDSNYLKDGVTQWLAGWKKRGWKTAAKQPVKNQDIWEQLDQVIQTHQIEWHWVKGHAGDEYNERCDELAREALEEFR